MPRFAAIDVGSNASRLLIVQARDPENVTVFRSLRVPVRLGHGVFLTGRLDHDAIDHSVAAMREFAIAMDEAGVDAYRAVVTASARGASNADILLDRVRDEAGITLTPVDGVEEARLVSVAVHAKMTLAGHTLLMDLGGGSLELSEMLGPTKTGFTVSLPIGTVRLLEAFLKRGGHVSEEQDQLVREYLDRILAPHARKLRVKPWKAVIATGGNFETLSKICPAARSHWPAIDVRKAAELLEVTKHMTARERMIRYGLREDRADVLVPALYVLGAMARLSRVSRIVVPGIGLKEGLVTELVEKHFRVWDYGGERDRLFGAALALGRRYHFDERHATQVTELTLQLFDAMARFHGLGADDRSILRIAALLHDIGDFVNPSAHHKHTQYLIANSDLMGLTPKQKELVGLVARYHRKSPPTLRHNEYRLLPEAERRRVRWLAGLLRVADALDRGHRSKVSIVECTQRQGKFRIVLDADEDVSLEAWTVARKAGMLEHELGRPIELLIPGRAAAPPMVSGAATAANDVTGDDESHLSNTEALMTATKGAAKPKAPEAKTATKAKAPKKADARKAKSKAAKSKASKSKASKSKATKAHAPTKAAKATSKRR